MAERRERGLGRLPRDPDDGRAPSRQLDTERTGQRAKAPPNLIRRPLEEPPMVRVQADLTAASADELRRRAAGGNSEALAELHRRGVGAT